MDFKNKKVAVLGWGINGVDATKYLLQKSAKVTVFDKKEELDFSEIESKDFELSLGPTYLKGGLKNFDYVFRTPGVYRYLPEILEAEKKGVLVTSAIKVFFDECPSRTIGITGTKGKGTTSTLIYEILKLDRKDVFLAGNIGYPVLELLPKLNDGCWVVLELSSFQLIDLHKSPHISVVLNITSDHMDWHKDRKEYLEAKTQIVKHQSPNDFAVLNYDYKESKKFERYTEAQKYYFSKKQKVKGAFVKNGEIQLNINDLSVKVGYTKDLLLRGEHNWENITAASCASALAEANVDSIKTTIFSFKGLEHRLELVRRLKGVTFYNDSFSTNPQTTMAAVDSFVEPATFILGGFNKYFNYDEMSEKIVKSKNIQNIVLIGEIEQAIKSSLLKEGYKGNLIELGKSDIKRIVEKCFNLTPRGGVVVFSPATSSFDMFNNYKERGLKFKEAVNALN